MVHWLSQNNPLESHLSSDDQHPAFTATDINNGCRARERIQQHLDVVLAGTHVMNPVLCALGESIRWLQRPCCPPVSVPCRASKLSLTGGIAVTRLPINFKTSAIPAFRILAVIRLRSAFSSSRV
jgi:hypothetical protein